MRLRWSSRIAGLILAASSLAPANAASNGPALFVAQDGSTTIYLFGTMHALGPQTLWLDSRVRAAFERSDELVLETLIPEPPRLWQAAVRARPSPATEWARGADATLRVMAEDQGKAVTELEPLGAQLAMLRNLPSPTATNPSPPMPVMEAAWRRGDQSIFTATLLRMRASSPDVYRAMFIVRNSRWADEIAARRRTPGTIFVAVGAGHLAGPDSLLVKLAERGLRVKRVD